jgi:hypothetical protein
MSDLGGGIRLSVPLTEIVIDNGVLTDVPSFRIPLALVAVPVVRQSRDIKVTA